MKNLLFLVFAVLFCCGLTFTLQAQACPGYGGGASGGTTNARTGGNFTGNVAQGTSWNSAQMNRFMAQLTPQQSYKQMEQFYADTDGSPYMFDEFEKGIIVMNDGSKIQVDLNYDSYQKGVVALNKDGEKVLLDGRYYQQIIVPMESETVVFGKPNPEKNDKFYEVLYTDGGFAFYKDFIASVRPGNVGMIDRPEKFMKKSKYYVIDEGGSPIAVNLKKKDIYEHFPQIRVTAMAEILDQNMLKLKDESDYKALFAMIEE